jgi:hypothetical protein
MTPKIALCLFALACAGCGDGSSRISNPPAEHNALLATYGPPDRREVVILDQQAVQVLSWDLGNGRRRIVHLDQIGATIRAFTRED